MKRWSRTVCSDRQRPLRFLRRRDNDARGSPPRGTALVVVTVARRARARPAQHAAAHDDAEAARRLQAEHDAQLAALKAKHATEAAAKRAALQARLDARKKAAFGAGVNEAEFAELEAEGAAELEALEGTLAASASAAVNAELVRQVRPFFSFFSSFNVLVPGEPSGCAASRSCWAGGVNKLCVCV